METLKLAIFYFLVADVVIVNIISWRYQDWYRDRYPALSRKLPLTKTWTIAYMVIVLWIGYLTFS